jgi:DNA-binding SARP family transcriptional activator
LIEFAVLGPLQISRDDGPVDIQAGMQQRLLAVLLSRSGAPIPDAGLVNALWGEDAPPTAKQTLSTYVRRLRRLLDDERRLAHGPPGYALTVGSTEFDALRFEELTAKGRSARRDGDLAGASTLFEQALGLWRGAAYADVAATPLVADEAQRLERQRLAVLEERVSVELDLGRHGRVPSFVDTGMAVGADRDALAAYLMLGLYRAGRPEDALTLFQSRRLQSGQRGFETSAALQRLHGAILRDEPWLVSVRSDALADDDSIVLDVPGVADTSAPPPRQLPARPTNFTGRREALAALHSVIATDDIAGQIGGVGVVSGVPGIGKTAVALHFGHAVAKRFPHGQLYADLASSPDPGQALASMLAGLGVRPEALPSSVEARAAKLRELTAGRALLVVLDGAVSAEQVRPLLPGWPHALTVVTSREPLPDLLGAVAVPLEPLPSEESVTLLAAVIGGVRAAREPAATAELARICGHHPLTLILVAGNLARRPRASVAEVLAELSAAGDDPLQGALERATRSLDIRPRRLFGRLVLHPGPDIDPPLAAALGGVTVDEAAAVLDQLAAVNLLQRAAPSRFRFHELVRQYASGGVDEPEAVRREALSRLLQHLVETAVVADELTQPGKRSVPRGALRRPVRTADEARTWLVTQRRNLEAAYALARRERLDSYAEPLARILRV